MSRSTPWKIADLVDFEFLLAAGSDAEETHWRGRLPDVPPGDEAGGRRRLFKAWVHLRRSEGGSPLPGESVAAGWRTLLTLALLAGLALGGSVTAGLLRYYSGAPVNVSWFLACTLGVQMLVPAIALGLGLLRASTDWLDDFHPLRGLLAALAAACSAGLRRLSGQQRERLRASLAVIGRKREIYGSLAAWPFLIVTQLFAVSYNLGILAVLLPHLTFTSMHFQWESTWVKNPASTARIVAVAAVPWSWFAPASQPTPGEIETTHNISRVTFERMLSDHDPRLSALEAWWPFLCYAVACYGLLLRGALLVFAGAKMRASLRGLTFDHEGCNALFRRLTGPVVQAQSGTAALEIPDASAPPTAHAARGGDCLTLTAADAEVPAEQLAAYIGAAFGWRVTQTLPVQIDHPSGNAGVLAALTGAGASVVIVVRARRAPIKAIALFLEKVEQTAGVKTEVILLLVGRKAGAGFARVEDEEFTHWKNFQAIHRLRVSLEKWSLA